MAQPAAQHIRPPGLEIDRRPAAAPIELSLNFDVISRVGTFQGVRLSHRHLVVASSTPAIHQLGGAVKLRVALAGYDLVLPLGIDLDAAQAMRPGEHLFRITELDQRSADMLAQLIRVGMTGWLPDVEDLARGWDEETPVKSAPAQKVSIRWRSWLIAALAALALGSGIAAIAQRLIADATTVTADIAAVTAPRIDIASAEYGTVSSDIVGIGTKLVPGQLVARIQSDALDADLLVEISTLSEAERVEVEKLMTSQKEGEVTWQDIPAGFTAAQGRALALERRQLALNFYSSCTCSVVWSAKPGSAVSPGTLLLSLASTEPDQVRIEARVSPQDALALHPGTRAEVAVPSQGRSYEAVVEAVTYGAAPIPKFGLPVEAGSRATIVLKPLDPSEPLAPGTPVSVVLSK